MFALLIINCICVHFLIGTLIAVRTDERAMLKNDKNWLKRRRIYCMVTMSAWEIFTILAVVIYIKEMKKKGFKYGSRKHTRG